MFETIDSLPVTQNQSPRGFPRTSLACFKGSLTVLSDLNVATYKPSEKACVVAMRSDYTRGVWAMRGASISFTLPAFAALIYVSTVTFQSDKGFASFLRVVRYLRDDKSMEVRSGDCARRCWFNQGVFLFTVTF